MKLHAMLAFQMNRTILNIISLLYNMHKMHTWVFIILKIEPNHHRHHVVVGSAILHAIASYGRNA